ncbi:MAG TPA: hypothetical protein VHS78_13840 [Candidatus Elarobacter sp.]|nr:hypothetical protein [Candidatus Elarobacter sp.]
MTLWLAVAIGLFATVLLDAAAAFGRAGSHAAADHAIEGAAHDAVADYQNHLQAALAQSPRSDANADRYANAIATLPNPLERTYPADPASSGTRFTVGYDVYPTTVQAPSCGTSDASAPDTIAWLQCNRFVAESRISLRVVVRVLDPSGNATLAQREHFVTLRLFAEPPYSAVAGRKDASAADPANADALASPAHEGDLAGDTLSGSSPAPLASAWPAGGTLIHVRYECHDGAGSCANAAPPDPDADLRAGTTWSNGNRPAP